MKRILILMTTVLLFGSSGFSQLFPKVDKQKSPDLSLIVLQFGKEVSGAQEKISNINVTAWIPIIEDEAGNMVKCKDFGGALVHVLNIYYAENIKPGKYKLKGFYHIYTDYDLLDEFEKTNPNHIAVHSPYDLKPYHVKQEFLFEQELEFEVGAKTFVSFGTYVASCNFVGGLSGTTADRWKITEDDFKYLKILKDDDYPGRYIKTWASPRWKKWNAFNPFSEIPESEYKDYFE